MLAHCLPQVRWFSQSYHTFRRRSRCANRPPLGAAAGRTKAATPKDKAMTSDDDFTQLDDPAFLAERTRVREQLEHTPDNAVSPELTIRYQAMNEEFLRRASAAWGGSQ
jgi:hypothetical protein